MRFFFIVLSDVLSEESDKSLRSGLTGKLRELQTQLEQGETAVLELKETSSHGGNVADVSSVFMLLKAFKRGFDKVDVSLQAEVLRDVVAEIEMRKEGIQIKIFGLSGGNLAKKRLAVSQSRVRTVSNLVDQAEYGTNPTYLLDFIQICFKPQLLNSAEIKHLYVKVGLSASQIADRLGVSKAVIVGWINRLKIGPKSSKGRMTNPNNFRHHNPPYGYKVKDNKLVLNKSELRICRAVVELMGRKKCGARETARELTRRGFKNRRGETKWGHLVVQQIYLRWKDKL